MMISLSFRGEVALRVDGRLCERIEKTPKQFVQLSEKERADLTQDFVQGLLKSTNADGKPFAPGSIDNYLDKVLGCFL